jgi:hypothetical protein
MLFECGFKVLKVLNFRDLEGNGTLIIAQKCEASPGPLTAFLALSGLFLSGLASRV